MCPLALLSFDVFLTISIVVGVFVVPRPAVAPGPAPVHPVLKLPRDARHRRQGGNYSPSARGVRGERRREGGERRREKGTHTAVQALHILV